MVIRKQSVLNTEKIIILDPLPFSLDPLLVSKRIQVRGNGHRIDELAEQLTKAVISIARPKALYLMSKVNRVDEATINIEGKRFSSRVLSKLFIDQETAFPYVITIGPELDLYNLPTSDILARFLLDNVKEMVLHSAGQSFENHIHKEYPASRLTHINPGEIDDWPVTQQKSLFSLFGEKTERIGVTLTEGSVIKPIKSRSGIYFPNNTGFETCRLCRQSKCPGRRAAYNADVVANFTG
jgi:hypothetical protein